MTAPFKVGDRVRLATPREEFDIEGTPVPKGSVGTVTEVVEHEGVYVDFDGIDNGPFAEVFGLPGWSVFNDELVHHTDGPKDES